jgi:hypothetical protein
MGSGTKLTQLILDIPAYKQILLGAWVRLSCTLMCAKGARQLSSP